MSGWVGIDLDGTLAVHESGDGIDTIGEPVAHMVKFVKELLAKGEEVRIMTARVWCPQGEEWDKDRAIEVGRQRVMIGDWCEKHIGKRLKVTCEKDYNMIALYDDRAVRVTRNLGRFQKECPKCYGEGDVGYSDTTMGRGGAGGQIITAGPCNKCKGYGVL